MDPLDILAEPEANPAEVEGAKEADEAPEPMPLRRRMRVMISLLILLVLIGGLLAIGAGKLQMEEVVSASMEPTLMIGDVIMADAGAMRNRYDIICLYDPEDTEEKLVKRIIGIPGDEVKIQDGILYLNGREEYSEAIRENTIEWKDIKVKVPPDHVYVMGDNRNNSHDSLNFGPVPYAFIRGVVRWVVWPPEHWGRPKELH